ncbi:MAG: acetylxylan esterase [Fimbriimonadales bacterium]
MQTNPNLLPYLPEDFDQFWDDVREEALTAKLDFSRTARNVQQLPNHRIDLLEFRGIHGETLHAWLAIPDNLSGRAPAFLWLPPYGRESSLPNEYTTREGMVSMSFNFHEYNAFYQTKYSPSEGYFAEGILAPHTWAFCGMTQNAIIAARVLEGQLEADEDRLAIAGLSQGGGMAIWTAANCPLIKCVVADLPFLSCMQHVFSKPIYRYPPKEITDFADTVPLGLARAKYTISYFDTVNLATKLKTPALLSYGLKDPACKPETVRAVYDAIQGRRRLIEYTGGHDWDPGMIKTNRDWMLETLNVSN